LAAGEEERRIALRVGGGLPWLVAVPFEEDPGELGRVSTRELSGFSSPPQLKPGTAKRRLVTATATA
jgi:hypothetical protein